MSSSNRLLAGTFTRNDDSAETASLSPDNTNWHRLYQFQEELASAKDLVAELTASLRFARQECGADFAMWYSGPKNRSIQVAASRQAMTEREWCESLVRTVVGRFATDSVEGIVEGSPLASLVPAPAACAFFRLRPAKLGYILVATLRPNDSFGSDALPTLRYLANALGYHQKHMGVVRGLRTSLLGMFKSLIQVVDARDSYSAGHSERVAQIARRIGEEMALSPSVVNDLYLAGLLHDIGTIAVADDVMLCPGKLTSEQMAQMRRHAIIGDELLASSRHVERLRPGIRNHHERWDGHGYPDGLRGEEIPLLARVVAVADACDALMSARRYRPPLSPPQIEAVFRRFADSQWDLQIVTALLKCSKEIFPPIYPKGVGDSAYYALSDVVSDEVERSTIFHPALDERLGNSSC